MSTLTAYRVAPQMEFKAAREIREAGGRAYVPQDRSQKRKTPTARGYVFADWKPAFAKHAKAPIGKVQPADLKRLYLARENRQSRNDNPFKTGQIVYRGETQATVKEISGRTCVIGFTMLGKEHRQAIHYSKLRPK